MDCEGQISTPEIAIVSVKNIQSLTNGRFTNADCQQKHH
jgi:hypothetical protein